MHYFQRSFCWRQNKNLTRAGFSLVEMVVVIGIVVVITGVVLANLPRFRSNISLDLIAQDVAITVRQAQVFGLGSRQFAADKFPAYGIHFKSIGGLTPSPQAGRVITLFADNNNQDGFYNTGDSCQSSTESGTECVQEFHLEGGVVVDSLCTGGGQQLSELGIVFERPKPEPKFSGVLLESTTLLFDDDYVKIVLRSERDNRTKTVIVRPTGQIEVSSEQTCDQTS
jgi:prepilin-type N-terminal cleavage/methylation domain-containing protein